MSKVNPLFQNLICYTLLGLYIFFSTPDTFFSFLCYVFLVFFQIYIYVEFFSYETLNYTKKLGLVTNFFCIDPQVTFKMYPIKWTIYATAASAAFST